MSARPPFLYALTIGSDLWLAFGAGVYTTPAHAAAPAPGHYDFRADLAKRSPDRRVGTVGVRRKGLPFGCHW